MKQGDIVYHKLTNQPLIIIEDIYGYDLEDNDTVECRYQDKNGEYRAEEFCFCELTKESSNVSKV